MCNIQDINNNLDESSYFYNKFNLDGQTILLLNNQSIESSKTNYEIIFDKDGVIRSIKLKISPNEKSLLFLRDLFTQYSKDMNKNSILIFNLKSDSLTRFSGIKYSSGDLKKYSDISNGQIFILDNYELLGVSSF